MSNRTLIEINHDYAHNIRDEPEHFAALMYRYLSSGSPTRIAGYLHSHFGVTIGPMRHHSDAEPFVPRGLDSDKEEMN